MLVHLPSSQIGIKYQQRYNDLICYTAGVAPGFARLGARFPDRGLYNRIKGIFLSIRTQFSIQNSPTGVKFSPTGAPAPCPPSGAAPAVQGKK